MLHWSQDASTGWTRNSWDWSRVTKRTGLLLGSGWATGSAAGTPPTRGRLPSRDAPCIARGGHSTHSGPHRGPRARGSGGTGACLRESRGNREARAGPRLARTPAVRGTAPAAGSHHAGGRTPPPPGKLEPGGPSPVGRCRSQRSRSRRWALGTCSSDTASDSTCPRRTPCLHVDFSAPVAHEIAVTHPTADGACGRAGGERPPGRAPAAAPSVGRRVDLGRGSWSGSRVRSPDVSAAPRQSLFAGCAFHRTDVPLAGWNARSPDRRPARWQCVGGCHPVAWRMARGSCPSSTTGSPGRPPRGARPPKRPTGPRACRVVASGILTWICGRAGLGRRAGRHGRWAAGLGRHGR